MHRMIATGVPLVGAGDGQARQVRAACLWVLAAGPPPLPASELARERYALTDALDDLAHAVDHGERIVIATSAWIRAAEVALAIGPHWTGSGKWLLRELRDLDPELAERWVSANGDPAAMGVIAREVLDRAGGPLFAGYQARGERPDAAFDCGQQADNTAGQE